MRTVGGGMRSDGLLRVLVAAKPDLMRNSLVSYLRVIPRVDILAPADDTSTAIGLARSQQPDALVADVNLSEADLLYLVKLLRNEQPKLNCIVLADNVQQKQVFLSAGANCVLLKGFLDDRLKKALLTSLPRGRLTTASDPFISLAFPPLPNAG